MKTLHLKTLSMKQYLLKMNSIYGMAYRFIRDIKSPKMVLNLNWCSATSRILRVYLESEPKNNRITT